MSALDHPFTRIRHVGDVMLVTLPGRPMVILNTARVAKDLLDKRGAIYSDRPPMILHMELYGQESLSNPKRTR